MMNDELFLTINDDLRMVKSRVVSQLKNMLGELDQ